MNDFLKYSLLTVAIAIFSTEGNAQVPNVLDGAYKNVNYGAYERETNVHKRKIPYPHLREADVMYMRRIWQVMDLQQKINHPYYFPIEKINDRKSLFDVIRDELEEDEPSIVAYSLGANLDDEFRNPMTPEDLNDVLYEKIERPVLDPDDNITVIGTKVFLNPVVSEDITRYMLKEDWIWDKQRSERYVRIIGIAPMKEEFRNDISIGYKPLFWLLYPECRDVFAEADVFNLFNDAQRRTYLDLFEMRYFSSYIVKESNVYDRKIREYAQGRDGLAEAERIKEELFILEHDLWHY